MRYSFCVIIFLCGLGVALNAVAEELSVDEFNAVVEALPMAAPSDIDPLTMSVTTIPADAVPGDSVIAVMKLRILPTWYIYAVVPPTQPFIEAEWILDPQSDLEIIDDWAGPPTTLHKDLPGTRIHHSGPRDLVFFREMEVSEAALMGEADVVIGLKYQICNPEYCLQPTTKKQTAKVRIATQSSAAPHSGEENDAERVVGSDKG